MTRANAANLLFQLVLDSRVTLGQGRVAGPAAGPGRAAQPEQGAVPAALEGLPLAQSRWPGQLGQRAEPNPYTALAAGSREGRNMRICILSALGNLLKTDFWEVKGLWWFPFCFLRAVPWGNEEDEAVRAEG